jgi:hypothetical protein
MAEVAERLAAAAQARPRARRLLWLAIPLAALLCAAAIAVPSLLDPLCGNWFGAAPFRFARRAAHTAHAAVFRAP